MKMFIFKILEKNLSRFYEYQRMPVEDLGCTFPKVTQILLFPSISSMQTFAFPTINFMTRKQFIFR